MREFIYRSTAGKIHRSLRTVGPQTVGQLAYWLRMSAEEVFEAVSADDRIGWGGSPESNLEIVMVRLVTKEALAEVGK